MMGWWGHDVRGLGLRGSRSSVLKRWHRWRPGAIGVDLGPSLLVASWRISRLVVVVVGLSVPPWWVVLIPSTLQSPPVPRKEPLPEKVYSSLEMNLLHTFKHLLTGLTFHFQM